jgi:hypothetical protein
MRWRIVQISPKNYKFTNVKSGMVMDMTAGSTADGTDLIQYPDNGAANQLWTFTPTGDGYYKFSPSINAKASLDVHGSDNSLEGAKVEEYAWAGSTNQQWSIKPHKENLGSN